MNRSDHLRTPLKHVRSLGAARSGVHHWWVSRLSSLALVPLCLWFVASVLVGAVSLDAAGIAAWLASPVTTLLLALMLIFTFLHGKLGLQVVIEDYLHGDAWKVGAFILNSALCYLAMAMSLFALLKLHFLQS